MSTVPHLTGKAGDVTRAIIDGLSIKPQDGANAFICAAWSAYQSDYAQTPAITGRVFELLIAHLLLAVGISPVHYQARFKLVPNADFDLVLYDPHRPVVLTLKTTLRERYKQADLEGVALKQVYRNAVCILLTLSSEGDNVKRKIESLDVTGLNSVIVIEKGRSELDKLIEELLACEGFTRPQAIMPMEATRVFA